MLSRLELRRLALRSTRDPRTWLPVLQDALLETYGAEFEEAVGRAHAWAARERRPGRTLVAFDPAVALRHDRFVVYVFTPDDDVRGILAYSGHVPVFIAENAGR